MREKFAPLAPATSYFRARATSLIHSLMSDPERFRWYRGLGSPSRVLAPMVAPAIYASALVRANRRRVRRRRDEAA